jgi:hypothetical protein
MRAHGSKFGVKTRPQNCQKLEKVVGKNQDFPSPKSDFLRSKFDFLHRLSDFREIQENLLQRLSNFFNAFLISVTAFKFSIFLNGFLIFLNGFPLSEKSGKIYLRRQIYERLLSKLHISRWKLQYSAIK